MKKGWFEESRRHRLARLGIKTGRKSSSKKELNVLEGNPMFFPKTKKEKLDYTPTYNPAVMGAVATDIVVGTGVEVKKHTPLIAGAIVYKKVKKVFKKGRRKKKKLDYPKTKLITIPPKVLKELVKDEKFIKEQNILRKKAGLIPLKSSKEMVKNLYNYPKETKKKYPIITKEFSKLSKEHNIKKPKLSYGKNKRLATFHPNKYIKLSTRLRNESDSKKKDVAQHEFKHYTDMKKTNIRDVDLLEKRAVEFERNTK